ncbi:hypothetical protein CCMA1212_001653 [Trichoderma ghanense]|uniref:Uncharacterized protein n=1 Tax=Trichoderma ghanense TaxID=65468 RepID=A0ABY2HEW1_9HYPO
MKLVASIFEFRTKQWRPPCYHRWHGGRLERLPAEGWGASASEYQSWAPPSTREWAPKFTPIAAVLSGAISLPRHGPLARVANRLPRRHCSSRTLPALFWNRRRSWREIEAGNRVKGLALQGRKPGNIGRMEARPVGHETFQKLHGLGLRNAQLALPKPFMDDKSYLR